MITLRRFLCLSALLFWQGGFTFYAAVVIPIAGVVLDPNLHQRARITDAATNVLNLAGLLACFLLLWDVVAAVDPCRRRFRVRIGLWIVLFATLAALFPLHYWLEILDPPGGAGPADRATFYHAHQIYLWVSAAQWLAALIYLGVTLRAWRAEDAKAVGWVERTRETHPMPREGMVGPASTLDPPYNDQSDRITEKRNG